MDLYFGGAEQGAWRELLYDNGVRHMSLSFMGLRRRVKRLDRWRLADKFPADVKVYLDSGAFTLNKPGSEVTAEQAAEIREAYFQFVSDNIHDLEFASEFDANVLGHEAVHSSRESFWETLPDRKWMPVWHAAYGTSNLVALGDVYGRVGVLQDDAGGDLTLALNRMALGTKIHGVAMTKMDALEAVRWSSAGSTRWLAPSQYGETFVWTGRELKDYPKKYQDQGRLRHRTWLAENGFDTDLIEAGNTTALLKLSIWSWQKYIAHVSEVTAPSDPVAAGNQEQPAGPVAGPDNTLRNEERDTGPAVVARRGERQLLPVVGFDFTTSTRVGEGGEDEEVTEARMTAPASSLMQCNTCFIRTKCPAMTPGAECAYELPVQVRTPAQVEAVRRSLAEMQVQRVLRMVMIEQTEGGYADPNLTAEINRAWKMLTDLGIDANTVKLTLEASGNQASAGTISRLFGRDAGDRLAALEGPRDTQTVAAEILEAEVISDG